ncbi:MAG TPA: response regulator, partial [Candidatus Handelsmanbacteria bacterium]|nr:response regulator [Candidatus Handelsmanbacteria bacterium]
WVGNALLAELSPGSTLGTSAILCPQIQWSAVCGNTDGVLLKILREQTMKFFEERPQRVFQKFCVNLFKTWVGVLSDRNARIVEIQRHLLDSEPATERRFSILFVDDEEQILAALMEYFEERYDLHRALVGPEAVACALARRPDLVVLDLHMPGMSGYEVCQQLKTHADTRHTPIIMLTALNATPDKVKGMMYGADEYLTKPMDLVSLDEVIKRVLDRRYG